MSALIGLALLAGALQWAPAAWGAEPSYIGAAKCKFCHMKAHKIWGDTEHARAVEILKPAEQTDPKCLDCHLTGYRDTQQIKAGLKGVECESCHGPASAYLMVHPKKDKEAARQAGLNAKPDAERCKTCHNPSSPTFKEFDYAKMWEKIKHAK
ncbi:MAG TPA: multiheme c-type cytochrome [Nitrospiria bacterium]